MVSFSVTERLARASARRPLVVVGLWVALFLICVQIIRTFGSLTPCHCSAFDLSNDLV